MLSGWYCMIIWSGDALSEFSTTGYRIYVKNIHLSRGERQDRPADRCGILKYILTH